MKTDQYFVFSIVIFLLGVITGVTFFCGFFDNNPGALLPAFATLIAAFLGAGTAFLLQNQKEKRKEIDENVAHGNEVIAALQNRINLLAGYRGKFIEPHRHNEFRWLEIRLPQYKLRPSIDLNPTDLRFLWKKGDVTLPTRVAEQKTIFEVVIDLIKTRSDFYKNVVIPTVDSVLIPYGANASYEHATSAMTNQQKEEIKLHTDNMIDNIDDVIESHLEVARELTKEIKSIYPNSRAC
ncbi:MAG: hypothetical protein AB2660_15085 [Candidatus Thiodiazotropha sp.]